MAKHATNNEDYGTEQKRSDRQPTKAGAAQSEVSDKPKKAFDIDIFMGWCKSCGICSAFCPRECIGRDENGSPVVQDPGRCNGCGWCEVHCPDFAISVRPQKTKTVNSSEE